VFAQAHHRTTALNETVVFFCGFTGTMFGDLLLDPIRNHTRFGCPLFKGHALLFHQKDICEDVCKFGEFSRQSHRS